MNSTYTGMYGATIKKPTLFKICIIILLADMVTNSTFIDGAIQLFAVMVHPHVRALTLPREKL